MKIAHVTKVDTAIPSVGSVGGGVRVAVANTVAYLAFLGKHEVFIYGSEESKIIEFATEKAIQRGYTYKLAENGRKAFFFDKDGKESGSLEFRSSGKKASNYSKDSSADNLEIVKKVIREDYKYKFDIIHAHGSLDLTEFRESGKLGKLLGQAHGPDYSPAKLGHSVIGSSNVHAEYIKDTTNANVIGGLLHGLPDNEGAFSQNSAGYIANIGRIVKD
jgi:hypothetical protein